jgi:hypothetical protein
MVSTSFQEELENSIGRKLKLKINDNRSTMLSVRWEPDCTKVSLHRMFLRAPQNVMEALACYIRQEHKIIHPTIKAFIEKGLKKLDYSHELKKHQLYIQGNVYNLKEIYNQINKEYFQGKLDLAITWFGNPNQRNRTRVTFGLYYDPLKLIKINRLLDSPSCPEYLVSYVVYHEMLHNVCPSYVDERGIHRVHSKEFKEQEVQFRYYDLAQKWIKTHQDKLFAR